jgi:hypothetical protein
MVENHQALEGYYGLKNLSSQKVNFRGYTFVLCFDPGFLIAVNCFVSNTTKQLKM